jgi:hypothetical protein
MNGATLPSISEMEASSKLPITLMRELAEQGAGIVRIPILESEMSQSFIPLKVLPLVHEANTMGLIVILAWNVVIEQVNNAQITTTEEWLRQLTIYMLNEPGVWIEPINEIRDIPIGRRRNVAQRYIDIIRGYRMENVMLINEPYWFLESNPELNKPLIGPNIVYGLSKYDPTAGYKFDQYPFFVSKWDGGDMPETAKIGTASLPTAPLAKAQAKWKQSDKACAK